MLQTRKTQAQTIKDRLTALEQAQREKSQTAAVKFKARKMPEFCKDGRFEKLIWNPALTRREREEQLRNLLNSKKGVDEHKFDYLLCMPERFQRYMIDQELRREYYQNKSVPFAKARAKQPKLGKINNIRRKRRARNNDQNASDSNKENCGSKKGKKLLKRANETDKVNIWELKRDSKSYSVPKIGSNQLAFLKNQRDKFKKMKMKKNDMIGDKKLNGKNSVRVVKGKLRNAVANDPVCHKLFFD